MKTLKFDHKIAQLVASGKVDTTWRIGDERDLSVDDLVQVIDKVDPQNEASWQVVSELVVDQVTIKRLGDLTKQDYINHEKVYESPSQRLKTFQVFYGPGIGSKTHIKLIKFTNKNQTATKGVKIATYLTDKKQTYSLYTDGGSRGNPGPSAGAYVVFDESGNEVQKSGYYIGITTNNQAEYQALMHGLEQAEIIGITKLQVFMDSLLVVNQLKGIYKVKNRDLWPIYQSALDYSKKFKQINFIHVPREQNKIADLEVNRVLDDQN